MSGSRQRAGATARAVLAAVLVAAWVAVVYRAEAAADQPVPKPASVPAPAPERPAPVPLGRVMPLGDSITQGLPEGGYRPLLADALVERGRPADFVGTLVGGPPGFADAEHEGHGRFRIDQLRAGVPGWMAATSPDVVLLMAGTNDLLGRFDPAGAPARMDALLDTIALVRPRAAVLVASIPPMAEEACHCDGAVEAYNSALRDLVGQRRGAGYPVSFVDMGDVGLADLADGLHPNERGSAKIAAGWARALEDLPPGTPPAGPTPVMPNRGYWVTGGDGGVFAVAGAPFFGSAAGLRLNRPVVGMAPTPTGKGYWLAGADGAVFAFGDARFHGSATGLRLNKPIVAIAGMPTGRGYWLVASDGGIFAYGDARFFGSTGGIALNRPIVAAGATSSGGGYWLVASDGGVFAFGDARFVGSAASLPLRSPVVGMAPTPTGAGYWFVAADGGVFAFGDAAFRGSLAGVAPAAVTGIAADPAGRGYVLATAAGEVRGFGGLPAQVAPALPARVPAAGVAAVAC